MKVGSNRRLAILGYEVVNLISTDRHFRACETKGTMQAHMKRIVGNDNLFAVGVQKDIGPFLHRDPGDYGFIKPKTMVNSVEAIFAAA
jgi:dsRNA-specific ribonuclease